MVKFGIYKAAKMKLSHQSVLWLSQTVSWSVDEAVHNLEGVMLWISIVLVSAQRIL